MQPAQPNKTLTNIAADLEQLAARADQVVPSLPIDEADALTQELRAIQELIEQATARLQALQQRYPEQLDTAS